jgi:putative flippase GtrA
MQGFFMNRINYARIIRFGLVGVAATATHWSVGLYLHDYLGWDALLANFVAFGLGFCVSYIAHHRWTFDADVAHRQALPRFLLTALFGLLLSQGIVWLFVHQLGQPYLLALAVSLFVVPAGTYAILKWWVFPDSGSAENS